MLVYSKQCSEFLPPEIFETIKSWISSFWGSYGVFDINKCIIYLSIFSYTSPSLSLFVSTPVSRLYHQNIRILFRLKIGHPKVDAQSSSSQFVKDHFGYVQQIEHTQTLSCLLYVYIDIYLFIYLPIY